MASDENSAKHEVHSFIVSLDPKRVIYKKYTA